ncbi:IclR family transcriptional regulator [Variovorax sp. LjRoot178]|uniref:IclR family transcriptional regulator n=1 Tax=Variovorax sp. LjRoot178 TaxID=3342277 RepID=UPI003ECE99AB
MRSVQRILAVFESFSPARTALSLQQIADRIELPKSTAFRIVRSLEECGYLVRLEDQRFCLSLRLTRLAGLVKSTLDIREISRPVMVELAAQTGETVAIYGIVGRDRVCIESIGSSSSPLRTVLQPGEQFPLGVGSASKVLMAYLSGPSVAPVISAAARATRRTSAQIVTELEAVRRQGYALSHGERLLGLSAVSAPIRDIDDRVRYCLTLNGPSVRMQAHEENLVRGLVHAAADISRLFGAPAEPSSPSTFQESQDATARSRTPTLDPPPRHRYGSIRSR